MGYGQKREGLLDKKMAYGAKKISVIREKSVILQTQTKAVYTNVESRTTT